MISIDLTGVVVAVTGASGGIGTGIATRFATAGASLVLQHHRTPILDAAADSCTVQADLTTRTGPAQVLSAALAAFGRLDAVVNNAGVQPVVPFMDVTPADWDEMIATNLTAADRLTRAFAAHVMARGGSGAVVHIASIEGSQPAVGHSHYATSKAALIMHARAAAVELGPRQIRVNSVSPGLIRRPGIDEAWPDGVGRWLGAAPLGRMGEAEEVGDACVFLCSPLASWISGIDLVVDGGISARSTW
jgi:NAD(P)-dependent dehydrogenase (short-subunit alcohol dehydrogenase family)